MTDLQQADLKPISAKTKTVTLFAGAISGAIIGLAAWSLLFTTSQAIAIVSIGRYDQGSGWIEEPQAVIERIKSREFASAAAARAGVPELSMLLPAKQYGGSGALSVRSLRDLNLLEIRISATQPELAQRAMTAVVGELIADHETKIAPLLHEIESNLAALDMLASEAIKSNDAIAKRISSLSQGTDIGQDSVNLLSTRALNETGLGALMKSASELKIMTASVRRSRAVTTPTVTEPKAALLYQTVAAGMLAGFLIGLLSLQMFPDFFRTNRPGAGIRHPDPI